ncbi:MAG: ABC transporter ATP-binding protein [Kiritimatiellaeota bacterium]|nr:ABC transporter ATP-binding protein [Kiritimatiellota bacterium]
MGNVIEINGLTKHYGSWFWKQQIPALDQLTIDIPEGAIFGFLGPNGAGKTTTIRLLMDLIRPTAGSALVLGMPPSDVKTKAKIGYLPDSPAFSSYLSAYEFLNICSKLLGIPSKIRKDRIAEVFEIVTMTKHANSKLGGFSRGMLQRIGIAQAILNKPRLLILDEPLVGLDPLGRQELKDIIMKQKADGANVFFCSHILSDVEKICDHLGILFEGRLLCSGKVEDLLSETGSRILVKPGNEAIAKQLMPEATGSIKLPDGAWELVFSAADGLEDLIAGLDEKHPGKLQITPSRENLEDFFFRKIDNEKKLQ